MDQSCDDGVEESKVSILYLYLSMLKLVFSLDETQIKSFKILNSWNCKTSIVDQSCASGVAES